MSTLITDTLCKCLHTRKQHAGNYRPVGDADFRAMSCYAKECECDDMQVIGFCECGHPADDHENINARFVAKTPCRGEVMGPTNFSGSIVRTMRCTCNRYKAKSTATQGVPA